MDDQKRALALKHLAWLLLLFTACRTATTPPETTFLPETPTSNVTSLTTATLPSPTPTISSSPTISPAPTATVTPLAELTPSLMLTEQMAHISGSPYAVIESSILDAWSKCCLTFSPDGQKITFGYHTGTEQKIYVQNIDGSGLKEISSLTMYDGDGPFPDPVWSPDGRYIAFVHFYGIYVVEADGTNLTRLEPEGFDPAWSPDGQSLAFTVQHSEKGLAIGVMQRDGSDFRQLTNFEAYDQRPAWSPDAQTIAFVSDRDGNREIYLMHNDGSDQRRLTNNEAQEWGPVFSPDGRYIVFSSDRDGHNGIYVMNSDGAEQRWLMAADTPQRWLPDTTRVRFVRDVQEVPPLSEEIGQSVVFTLAQQFRVNPDEIELVSWQQTTWPNGCLGIDRRQLCPQGETPGYRLRLKIKGVPYEFRSSATDPLNLRLAVGPAVYTEYPALLWEGEPALFGGAKEGSCLSFSLSAAGQGSLGVCDGPQRAVELTGEQFARPELWQDWLTRFAYFEADTPHGRVVFQGQGPETASPAWQRALAAWAKLAALELNDGRSGASWGTALAWQQPLSDRPGYCQFLSVQIYGWAYASTARCDGGDPQNLDQGWIDPAQWEQFDAWFYHRAPLATDRLSFFGVGSMEMREDDKAALARWAKTLYDARAESGSVTVPAAISQIRGSQNTLTFYPLPKPDGYVRALAIDRTGRVWVASAANLNILEPETQTWTVYSAANGVPRGANTLTIDGQGQVWAGTANGIGIFDGQTLRAELQDEAWQSDLPGHWVTALAMAPDESIWAGTSEGSVYRFDNQRWTELKTPPVGTVDTIAMDQAGQVWVGGLGGVAVWNGAAWTHYQHAAGFELQKTNVIAVGPNGDIWLGAGACYLTAKECTNGGLSRFDGQNWTHNFTSRFREMGGSSKRVFAITFDQVGNGWFGSGEGLRKFDGQAWTSFSEFNETVGDVHAIVVDRTGNIWLGGSQGVSQLEMLPLTTLTVAEPQTYTDPELDFSLN